MKKYTKNWLSGFTITLLSIVCFVLTVMLYSDNKKLHSQNIIYDDNNQSATNKTPEDYKNFEDNVGAVSFTEDQITELVRNIYFSDGIMNGIKIELLNDNTIVFMGKIKDINKLCEFYPELEFYQPVLKNIENKQITVKGSLVDNNGMADFEIDTATVGDIKIDKLILKPFVEQGEFAKLFNVQYSSIVIRDGFVIFNDQLPEVLRY